MTLKRNRPAVGSVFSDPSGRRRKRIRRVGYAAAGGCVTYMGLVAISLAGGPISPEEILPPGVPDKVEALLNPESSQARRDGSADLADMSTQQPAAQPDGGDWVNRGTAFNPPGSRTTPQPGATPTPGGDTPTTIAPPVPAPTESPVPVEPPATTAPPLPSEPPALPSSPVAPTGLESPAQVDPPSLPTSLASDPTGGVDVPTLPDSGGVADTPSLPESSSG